MNSGTHASVMGNRKNKAVVETVAQIVFTIWISEKEIAAF